MEAVYSVLRIYQRRVLESKVFFNGLHSPFSRVTPTLGKKEEVYGVLLLLLEKKSID